MGKINPVFTYSSLILRFPESSSVLGSCSDIPHQPTDMEVSYRLLGALRSPYLSLTRNMSRKVNITKPAIPHKARAVVIEPVKPVYPSKKRNQPQYERCKKEAKPKTE